MNCYNSSFGKRSLESDIADAWLTFHPKMLNLLMYFACINEFVAGADLAGPSFMQLKFYT